MNHEVELSLDTQKIHKQWTVQTDMGQQFLQMHDAPFYAPALIDRGHMFFGPSICLSAKTFTLDISSDL